ncbi:hypothetical protein MHM88_11285 [Epibacterium sp. MM17-32]|uniref:phage nozzle protein n=1 Tax=Epibacterium sp. MM17-32 TaxID=2917734 RepID=UPI001EF5BA4C|nr:hypothetical protein [Epibacterium sp. MM17-32]MCG7628391.1 hypothetical protein [Epibacterium sp. MM17-32]
MPLISEQLPNLMNGVSQQAVTMRMSSQGEAQENALSSLLEGNVKRPPTRHLAKIRDGSAAGAHIHTINRDADEEYIVIAEDRSVKVYDLEGDEKTVAYPDGTDYIASDTPFTDFRAITVADFTFFVNRNVEVATLPDKSPENDNGTLIFIKSSDYDVTYKITVDGEVVATATTPDTGVANADLSIDSVVAALARQLRSGVPDDPNATPTFPPPSDGGSAYDPDDYEVVEAPPVLYLKRKDGGPYRIDVTDDQGNSHTDAIRDKVQRFTDLPVVARRDYVVAVTGDDESAFDEYYLKFVPDNDSDTYGDGVWEETVAPAVEYKIDPSTMPHVLVRMPDGSFELREAEWSDRVAGDAASAPFPSFVGGVINDVYFDRRRLCFLSGDNVIMSEAGEFFNFMPTTVLQVLDDGRIDVSTTGTQVANLQYAVAFNQKILLFSDQVQYVIDAEFLLASKPPGVKQLSNYSSSGFASPVASGRTLFFAVNRGDWAGVLEYYVLGDSDETDAADITEHVPKYIPATTVRMASSPTADVVTLLSDDDRSKLYVYKHHWQGTKKLQSSWSRWSFPPDASIQNVDFIKDECLLLIDYPDGVYLETLNVASGGADEGEDFVYRLDRRISEADLTDVSYDIRTNRTTMTLPYVPGASEVTVVTRDAGGTSDRPAGQSVNVTGGEVVGGQYVITVLGDYTNTKVFLGILYSHEYSFSQAVIKTSSGNGGVASALAGRLQVLRWYVHVKDTGYFRAVVTSRGRAPRTKHFSGFTLGYPSAVIGKLPLRSDVVSFGVKSRADAVEVRLVNDTFLPSAFTAAEWEGRYTRNKSRA